MSVEQQVAYTAPFSVYCPEYVNLSLHDNGSNILSVRTQGEQKTSVINIPPEELMRIGQAMVYRAIRQGVKVDV